ncbi:MAG: hypothetical protein AB1640_19980 [bacterium]
MGECQNCKDLDVEIDIRSPGELKKTLDMARKYVAAGILAVLRGESRGSQPFEPANSSGPWNDVVNHLFRCTSCGRKFELFAETYHGRGGFWRPAL